MIQSFTDKETEKVFHREISQKIPQNIQQRAYRKLVMIHASVSLNDLRSPPSNHLEKLKGDHKNKYSIRINDQWRICFFWKDHHSYQVGIEDYH